MRCHFCDNPATVHLTDIVNNLKRETHLCEACAREKNLLPDPNTAVNVPALLELVLGQLPTPAKIVPHDIVCPECGTPYAHFRAQGRLGCPHDYEAFRSLLEPLLEKVHNNAIRHMGKVPKRHRARMQKARRAELEASMKAAIAAERYEDAARLRDQLRGLGTENEP